MTGTKPAATQIANPHRLGTVRTVRGPVHRTANRATLILKVEGLQSGSLTNLRQHTASNDVDEDANCNWKEAFKRAYLGLPSWRYNYNRGYCSHCNSVVWLNNLWCPNTHSKQGFEDQHLKFLSPTQIVGYILDDTCCLLYSSDSDSESDDEFGFKFWPYRGINL